MDDNKGLGGQYVNLGKLYNESENDYETAISYYKKSINIFNKVSDNSGISIALANIGRNYIQLNTLDSAQHYLNKALKINKEINEEAEVGKLLTNLGEVAYLKKNLNQAENYLNQAVSITSTEDYIEDYSDALSLLSDVKAAQGNYKQAYKNHIESKKIIDSIMSVEKLEKFAEIEVKYQTAKKEKDNLKLIAENTEKELQLEKENKRKWYFAFGLLVSLLTLGVFGFYYRRNKKQKAIIENLQKDLHHRVKNNLAIIDSLVEDIKDEFDNEIFTSKLTDLQNRINSINEVHQQLYKSSDITNLKLKKYVEKLANNVQQSFAKENISINNTINDSLTLNVEQSFPIGLIINEFLTNSFKYAFSNEEKGIVNVDLKDKGENYLLSLSDNGKGLPNDFDISKLDSFGVDVMKLLSKQLKGTFSLDGTNGVKLNIEFPKV